MLVEVRVLQNDGAIVFQMHLHPESYFSWQAVPGQEILADGIQLTGLSIFTEVHHFATEPVVGKPCLRACLEQLHAVLSDDEHADMPEVIRWEKQLLTHPKDAVMRLVYADWLADRGLVTREGQVREKAKQPACLKID
jgi:uncharacterized protein (TIGR02996 family)